MNATHVWGAKVLITLSLLDSVQKTVISYSFIDIFMHAIPLLPSQIEKPNRQTRLTVASYKYTVEFCTTKTTRCDHIFVPIASRMQNSLPLPIRPISKSASPELTNLCL